MRRSFTIIFSMLSIQSFCQNVGIGTTTPDEKLQVDSVIRVGKNQIIEAGSTKKNLIKFGDGNFVTVGEQDKDDRLVMRAGSFTFKTGKVGIGIDSATEALEVDGNIKTRNNLIVSNDLFVNDNSITSNLTTTTLKINGGSLQAGKILTSDGAGNATWQTVNTGCFQNLKEMLGGSQTWTIPINVTKLFVEMWGAGGNGGGTAGGGGGGGGGAYASFYVDVLPGNIIFTTIKRNVDSFTQFRKGADFVKCFNGDPGKNSGAGLRGVMVRSGLGFSAAAKFFDGQDGEENSVNYVATGSGTGDIYNLYKGGRGGNSYGSYGARGQLMKTFNTGGAIVIGQINNSPSASTGAGGGATVNGSSPQGQGGSGAVLISY